MLGPEDPVWPRERRVKVNIKKLPTNTKMGVDSDKKDWKKTTLVKLRGSAYWEVFEHRVKADYQEETDPTHIEWLISFYNHRVGTMISDPVPGRMWPLRPT